MRPYGLHRNDQTQNNQKNVNINHIVFEGFLTAFIAVERLNELLYDIHEQINIKNNKGNLQKIYYLRHSSG